MKKIAIIGSGIVGLTSAYKLKLKYPKAHISIFEKEGDIAQHQTGNNSGVIHSGIYYKPGSLKARNCADGYQQLLKFCKKFGVEYEVPGKIIVATNENQKVYLNELQLRGKKNGLKNISMIGSKEIKKKEYYCEAKHGLFVPQTGIINYKELSRTIYNILISENVNFYFNHEIKKIIAKNTGKLLVTNNSAYYADLIIVAAGLHSDTLARYQLNKSMIKIIPFRGEYFKLKNEYKYLVKNLIYPVPNPNFPFLGVHFTRMINGDIECGPNAVFSFSKEGYGKFDFNLIDTYSAFMWPGFRILIKKYFKEGMGEFYRSYFKSAFTKELQKLIPEIKSDYIIAGTSGVRAQACDIKGNLIDDFVIEKSNNLVHVINAPSPAATSSFAIADYIVRQLT